MWVDFKVTAWERVFISEVVEAIVLDMIKTGKIKSSQDLHKYILADFFEPETGLNDLAQMTVEENRGYETLIVYENNGKGTEVIYHNGDY